MWFIGVEVEQETSAPRPKKNPGSAPALGLWRCLKTVCEILVDAVLHLITMTHSTFGEPFKP